MMEIYHPLPGNGTTNATFIDEITDFLADRMAKYNNIVIMGDLNIHVDDLPITDFYIFNDAMHAFSFKQYVTSPNHKCGHPLDLIFSKMSSELNLHNFTVHESISDHTLVTVNTTFNKAPWEPTEKTIRDTTRLSKDILEKYYTSPVIENNISHEQACDKFNEELHKMLNRAAPPKNVRYANRPKSIVQLHLSKKELSKRRIISTENTGEITTGEPTPPKGNRYNRLLKYHKKKQVITKQIMDNSKNTKELFRIVNNFMGSNTDNPLPPGKMTEEMNS